MDEFLAVAKSLEIKELCNADNKTEDELDDEPSSRIDQELPSENLEDPAVSDQIKMQEPQKRQRRVVRIDGRHEGVKYVCDQCDHQFTLQSSLSIHIQSIHEGVKYACDQCDHQFTQQAHLRTHIQSKHEGIRYACDQCDYQATQQGNLRKHIQLKHEGVKFACDKCDYQTTTQSKLTKHVRSKHEHCL